jgi:hypothetical protein
MPDRTLLGRIFDKATDREDYERQQLLESVPEDARRLLADRAEKALKEKEKKEREQKNRYQEDIEKKASLHRQRQEIALKPRGAATRLSQEEIARITALAEREVQADNKAELDAIDKQLQREVDAILALHAPGRKAELDKERETVQELAGQKRQDRETTRIGKQIDAGRPAPETVKDHQPRGDDFSRRVADRIRNARERHDRAKDYDGRERD